MFLTQIGLSQFAFDYDTYNNVNDAVVQEVFDTNPLVSGSDYCLTVTGTYSIWIPSFWSSPCGFPESAPMFPSLGGAVTGIVGFDIEYKFSFPNASACAGETFPAIATPTPRIEFTLDNGLTWFDPSTTTPYNSGHQYEYPFVGQGFPLGVRHNSPLNSDDYGILKFNFFNGLTCDLDSTLTAVPVPLNYPNPPDSTINLSNDIFLLMPNTFTPNGDGVNELFKPIATTGIDSYELNVYNRWGQILYKGSSLVGGWDGRVTGEESPEGTYYWTVNYMDIEGNNVQTQGYLFLNRN